MAQQPLELEIQVPKGPTPWTSLDIAPPVDHFQFAIVTDRTGGLRPGVFSTAVDKLNLLQPQFIMSVGDFITGYTSDRDQVLREWEDFDSMIDRLDAPFFYVPGNHDITNPVMQTIWEDRFGPTYYHFVYKDVMFLCLNTEDQTRGAGRGSIGDEQYAYIQKALKENEDVRWTFVFLHQPLWDQENPDRWPDVERLLEQREHSVFAGHVHHFVRYARNNGRYYTLATTGGGSRLRGPKLGEFDHVSWVTMTDEGPIMANIALDGITSDSVVTSADYDFISGIFQSQPVRFVGSDGESVMLQLHNPADRPAHVTFDPGFSFDYTMVLPVDTVTVAPNSVEEIEIQLVARDEKPSTGAGLPLDIDWAYTYEGEALHLPLSYRVGPDEQLKLTPGRAAVVDGDLSEWAELPYSFSLSDRVDMAVKWGLRYTDDSLYLAAEVTDNDVQVIGGVDARQQDYLSFIIDAAPYSETVVNTGDRDYRNSIQVLASPETEGAPGGNDADLSYRSVLTLGGYQMEVAIPLSYVRERQGENWRHVRINVVVQDRDAEEEDRPRTSWRPEWRGKSNVVGSGLFWR